MGYGLTQHDTTARNDGGGMVSYFRYTVFTGKCPSVFSISPHWGGKAVCLDTGYPFSSAPIFYSYDIIFYIHCKFTFMYWYGLKTERII